jgi:hypothetical protein
MESKRFDALSRTFAARTSRRDALRRFGLGGLGAGALAAAGVNDSVAATATAVCVLTLTAPVVTGPDKGTAYDGDLSLTIGSTGAIDDASLKLTNGKTHKAVGQATGRALNVRIDLGGGKTLALSGTGEQDLILCRGAIDGTFGGPDVADLGTWHAIKKSSAGGNGPVPAATVIANGTPGGAENESGSGTIPASVRTTPPPTGATTTTTTTAPTATTTTTTAPTATTTTTTAPCAKTNESCASAPCCIGFCDQNNLCECVPDGSECQHTGTGACCSGAPCNADGFCGACVLLNAPCTQDADCCTGQTIAACCFDGTRLANVCTDVGAAGVCPGQAPAGNCPAGQTACGANCADLSSDARNCGACGTSCGLGAVCTGGACVSAAPSCLPDQSACTPGGGTPCCDFLTCENQGTGFLCQCSPSNDVCADSRQCCSGTCKSDGFCA